MSGERMFIGGEWVTAESGETFAVMNPTTAQPLTGVSEGRREGVSKAADAARSASESGPWPLMTPGERPRVLLRMAETMEAQADDLAKMGTQNMGKPIKLSRDSDVPNCVDNI